MMSMRCRAARQRREFKELEEEAFPSFPTRPLPMLNGRRGGAEQCIAGAEDLVGKVKGLTVIIDKLKSHNVRGAEAGRLMAVEDTEGREEEEVGSRYALQGGGCCVPWGAIGLHASSDTCVEHVQGSSTSTVSSSSLLAEPFNGRAGEAKDALTPPRLDPLKSTPAHSSPWGGKNEPFHRVDFLARPPPACYWH